MDASIIAGLFAGLGAVIAYFLGQRYSTLERKRQTCSQAMSDALSWLEIPYRIRRRPDDSPETLKALTETISDLRVRLNFHREWIAVELPEASERYNNLLSDVMRTVGPAIQEAWVAPYANNSAGMNTGNLGISDCKDAVEAFSNEVKNQLTILAWLR